MCNFHNNLYHMPWLEIKTKQNKQSEISSERDQQPQSNRLNSTGLLQAQNYRLSEVVVCADELG